MSSKDGGGDSSHVSHQLVKVQHIWGSLGAFAALRSDGQLVTWGDQQHGGDSSDLEGKNFNRSFQIRLSGDTDRMYLPQTYFNDLFF